MTQHAHVHKENHGVVPRDFSVRFRKNLRKEILQIVQYFGFFIRILLITIVGILTFLSEFTFVRMVIALVAPPLFIYIVGTNLTILPVYLIALLALVSVVSLSSSKEGGNLMDWFNEILSSIFEASIESSPSSVSQKLIGFVGLSVIVSFFLVIFI